MKLIFGMKAWGWWMAGLLGKNSRWFLGFSKALPQLRPQHITQWIKENPYAGITIVTSEDKVDN